MEEQSSISVSLGPVNAKASWNIKATGWLNCVQNVLIGVSIHREKEEGNKGYKKTA